MPQKIFLAADHRGWELKEKLFVWLTNQGHQVINLGAQTYQAEDDYPDYAQLVGQQVGADSQAMGILICGSGVGMSLAANKITGVRAGLLFNPIMAHQAKAHNQLNVACLGADFIDFSQAQAIVQAFLQTDYSPELRHQRRVAKISQLEKLG